MVIRRLEALSHEADGMHLAGVAGVCCLTRPASSMWRNRAAQRAGVSWLLWVSDQENSYFKGINTPTNSGIMTKTSFIAKDLRSYSANILLDHEHLPAVYPGGVYGTPGGSPKSEGHETGGISVTDDDRDQDHDRDRPTTPSTYPGEQPLVHSRAFELSVAVGVEDRRDRGVAAGKLQRVGG